MNRIIDSFPEDVIIEIILVCHYNDLYGFDVNYSNIKHFFENITEISNLLPTLCLITKLEFHCKTFIFVAHEIFFSSPIYNTIE